MNHNDESITGKERLLILLAWIGVLAFFIFSVCIFQSHYPVTVHFISIEQGDASLILGGHDGTILIDGGDKGSGEILQSYFDIQNVNRLDAVFISHFHEDHVSGILELLDADFPISHIYISKYESHTELEKDLYSVARKKKIPVTRLNTSQELRIGDITYQVVSQEPYEDEEHLNNMSMILRADYYTSSVLYTGDIEKDGSKRLVSVKKRELDADVLKIPHHGGASSASGPLLDAVSPQYSVISVGKENQYGNPADITLAYLLRENTKIYRTDRDGTIVMTLGKEEIQNISYYNKRRLGK